MSYPSTSHPLETDRGSAEGLSLLPLETILEKNKSLKQTKAVHLSSGCEVEGYEIHHGKTTAIGETKT
ncbi:hypothetical protein CH378_20940, partial [Leptospira kmetyi]